MMISHYLALPLLITLTPWVYTFCMLYSSCFFFLIREEGSSATVLYTLERPSQVQFSASVSSALVDTITSASTVIRVASIMRFGKKQC